MNAQAKVPRQDNSLEPKPSRSIDRISEVLTIVLLAVMAVLTAWCGFQASKWGGEMSIAFSNASSARAQSNNAEGTARDARLYDMSMYTQWVLAEEEGNEKLRKFVEERFTPEMSVAFEQWEAEGREQRGPLSMDSYVPPGTEEASELSAEAAEHYQRALDYNQKGDDYSLLTVIFALVLFLTAISQRMIYSVARLGLLAVATVVAVGTIVVLVTFPVLI